MEWTQHDIEEWWTDEMIDVDGMIGEGACGSGDGEEGGQGSWGGVHGWNTVKGMAVGVMGEGGAVDVRKVNVDEIVGYD